MRIALAILRVLQAGVWGACAVWSMYQLGTFERRFAAGGLSAPQEAALAGFHLVELVAVYAIARSLTGATRVAQRALEERLRAG